MNGRVGSLAWIAAALVLLWAPGIAGAAEYKVDDGSTTVYGPCPAEPSAIVGDCSLRDAIDAANATGAGDTITFDVGAGQVTVFAATMPDITEPVTIDGTTNEPGHTEPPIVVSHPGTDGLVFTGDASGSVVRGLVLGGFSFGAGVRIDGVDEVLLEHNFIGTNGAGTAANANLYGVRLQGAGDTEIGGPDATDQIGSEGTPGFEEDGNLISGNTFGGVRVESATGGIVRGNLIGTNADGTAAIPNGSGVDLTAMITGMDIGVASAPGGGGQGNVISGNDGAGVSMRSVGGGSGTDEPAVRGNLIGLSRDGTTDVGNGTDGIEIGAPAGLGIVGGTAFNADVEPNWIAGNDGWGIRSTVPARIDGAIVGLNFAGTAAVPNGLGGIDVQGENTRVGGGNSPNVIAGNDGPGVRAGAGADDLQLTDNRIGVTDAPAEIPNDGIQVLLNGPDDAQIGGNTIGGGESAPGGAQDGLVLSGALRTQVAGNRIGVSTNGAIAYPNHRGIVVDGDLTVIGPASFDGQANTISGNAVHGIEIEDAATSTQVHGNRIGIVSEAVTPDPMDAAGLPNFADGIVAKGQGVRIGSVAANDRNRIAFNGGNAITVDQSVASDVSILGNSFEDNSAALPIDFVVGGVFDVMEPNDAPEADGITNHPVFSTVSASGSDFRANGALVGKPNTPYRIEAFQSASGECQGRQYLAGDSTVSTDGAGNASFRLQSDEGATAQLGDITATATELSGATPVKTSHSSPCTPATNGADLVVTQAPSPGEVEVGDEVTYEVTIAHGGPVTQEEATNVLLTNVLPSDSDLVASDCPQNGATVVCSPSGGTLAPGESETFEFTVRPESPGQRSIGSIATNDQADATQADRSRSRQLDVVEPEDDDSSDPPPPSPPPEQERSGGSGSGDPPPPLVPPRTIQAQVVSGEVTITLPDGRVVSPSELEEIPVGARVDATNGKVRIVTSVPAGDMTFSEGIFVVGIAPDGSIDLRLVGALGPCPPAKQGATSTRRTPTARPSGGRPRKRKLWGDGKGRFRISGKHSAAVVRGTRYSVEDSCDGTLTVVERGAVQVKDHAMGLEPLITAGRKYLAKPLPLPSRGRTVNLIPTGRANPVVRLASGRTIELGGFRQVPATATVDATRGGVRLVSSGVDVTQFVTFTQGAFRITGQRGQLLSVALADAPTAEPATARSSGRKPKRRRKRARKLWGDGKGSFKVSAKHSAAVVRGTKWLVQETDEGTLTRVVEGIVAVQDFRLRRTVDVGAGDEYVARP